MKSPARYFSVLACCRFSLFFSTFPSPLFACFACILHWGDGHHDDAVYHYKDGSVWISHDVRDHLCLRPPFGGGDEAWAASSMVDAAPPLLVLSSFPFSIQSPLLSSVHHDGRALRLRVVFLGTSIL